MQDSDILQLFNLSGLPLAVQGILSALVGIIVSTLVYFAVDDGLRKNRPEAFSDVTPAKAAANADRAGMLVALSLMLCVLLVLGTNLVKMTIPAVERWLAQRAAAPAAQAPAGGTGDEPATPEAPPDQPAPAVQSPPPSRAEAAAPTAPPPAEPAPAPAPQPAAAQTVAEVPEGVQRLAAFGLIAANAGGDYRLQDPITRAELLTVLVRALGWGGHDFGGPPPVVFTDTQGHWGAEYISKAIRNLGIDPPMGPNFHPDAPADLAYTLYALRKATGLEPVQLNAAHLARDGAVTRKQAFTQIDDLLLTKREDGRSIYQRYHDGEPPSVFGYVRAVGPGRVEVVVCVEADVKYIWINDEFFFADLGCTEVEHPASADGIYRVAVLDWVWNANWLDLRSD